MENRPDIASQSIHIRPCEAREILPLRHQILRAGLPFETARFDGDTLADTRHFAAEHSGVIIGCVSILHSHWNQTPAWQLRGMAVSAACQNQGVGRMLLGAVERFVQSDPYSKQLWCNARLAAINFYQKNGWRIASDEFEIPTAGPHFKMTWQIAST